MRIVIDRKLQLPKGSHLFDRTQPTIVFNEIKGDKEEDLVEYVKIDPMEDSVKRVIEELYSRKVQSLMVEGGSKLLSSFIEAGLWDEARIFRSKQTFGKGIPAPFLRGQIVLRDMLEEDELIVYRKL
jgi:diaminohydroxyphosphoribosylaminopyrimidine deaminase/5-amino-6-(5-phosphoribosylamino)uracil reductase